MGAIIVILAIIMICGMIRRCNCRKSQRVTAVVTVIPVRQRARIVTTTTHTSTRIRN